MLYRIRNHLHQRITTNTRLDGDANKRWIICNLAVTPIDLAVRPIDLVAHNDVAVRLCDHPDPNAPHLRGYVPNVVRHHIKHDDHQIWLLTHQHGRVAPTHLRELRHQFVLLLHPVIEPLMVHHVLNKRGLANITIANNKDIAGIHVCVFLSCFLSTIDCVGLLKSVLKFDSFPYTPLNFFIVLFWL